jgi:hypothetical protein
MWSGIGLNGHVHFGNHTFPARVVHQSRSNSRGCHGVVDVTTRTRDPPTHHSSASARGQRDRGNQRATEPQFAVVTRSSSSTVCSTVLTTPVTAPVTGVVAGTALPTWLTSPVAEDPTAPTALPTPAATAAGALPPESGGGLSADPPGDATALPVVVAAPLKATCPGGSLTETTAPAGSPNASAPDPTVPVSEPGALGPVEAVPEV